MKKCFQLITPLTLLACLLFSESVLSRGGGMSFRDGLFWSADLNRNEQLTLKESQVIYNLGDPKVFKKYDRSGEGLISKFEFFDYLLKRSNDE
jgi:hypothetical protein